jgi:uncharacterized protein (TIGR00725 family)
LLSDLKECKGRNAVFGGFDKQARDIALVLPDGGRLGIIGSSMFWGFDSPAICKSVGRALATIKNLVLLTGGVSGVGEAIGRAYWQESRSRSGKPAVFHILPRGFGSWDYGVTIHAGVTMWDRREILGRLASVFIMVEGGPGTVHEARVACERNAVVVPIARTGGYAAELYSRLDSPAEELNHEWASLADTSLDPDNIAVHVTRIINLVLRSGA